jgi:hypothetical protein
MAQSVARKGAPVLRIAYPIWVFGVILTPMPPLPVAPYDGHRWTKPVDPFRAQVRTVEYCSQPSCDNIDRSCYLVIGLIR